MSRFFPDGKAHNPNFSYQPSVVAVAVRPDGTVFSGGRDGRLRVWRGEAPPQEWTGHAGPVLALTLTPDQGQVVSGGREATVRLWHIATGVQYGTSFDANGSRLLSSIQYSTIHVYDVATRNLLHDTRGHVGIVFGSAASNVAQHLDSTGK